MDASNISKRLWVGGKPPFDRPLPLFDTLVLCAQELQPERLSFEGQVIRVPLPDTALEADELRRALVGGKQVAQAIDDGKRVLVTCLAGMNRSAFVAGLALGLVTRMTAGQIIELIRAKRDPDALFNDHFVRYLNRFVPERR